MSWLNHLQDEFNQPYMLKLKAFLAEKKRIGETVYPENKNIFNALNSTAFEEVKVVILGQDPYHGPQLAHGLSFSVQQGMKPPPSLVNIFKELQTDIGINSPTHGDLSAWASQGVLLLNSILTVNQSQAGSHQGQGWEVFTDKIISQLNKHHQNIVFMLWGAYAQKKGAKIDANHNLVLKSVHPSPLSAYRGFLGCQHFSKCNEYLQQNGRSIIDWQV